MKKRKKATIDLDYWDTKWSWTIDSGDAVTSGTLRSPSKAYVRAAARRWAKTHGSEVEK